MSSDGPLRDVFSECPECMSFAQSAAQLQQVGWAAPVLLTGGLVSTTHAACRNFIRGILHIKGARMLSQASSRRLHRAVRNCSRWVQLQHMGPTASELL